MSNRQDLPSKLAQARQRLSEAQAQVAVLEAQLFEGQPGLAASMSDEARYYHTLDHLLEGCLIVGFDWRYIYINDMAARHAQRQKDEMVGYSMMALFPNIEQTSFFATAQQCMQQRIAGRIENELIDAAGISRWFEFNFQPVPEGIFILSMDISERKRAEAALKRYARRLEILHTIDIGIINASSIQAVVATALKHIREIIPCQRASVGLFDYDHHEWYLFVVDSNHDTVGEGSRFPIVPGSLENFSQKQIEMIDDLRSLPDPLPAYRQFIEEGLVSALHAHFFLEERPLGALNLFASTPGFFTAEHQEIATQIASQLAIAIKQLQLSEALTQHTALLENRVNERTAELLAAKERVEAILNNSVDGILLLSAAHAIEQTNPAFNRLFACDADEYTGKSLFDLIHDADRERLSATIRALVGRQSDQRIEVRAKRKDGTYFEAEVGAAFVIGDGFVCTIQNIAERKEQERQLRYHASLQENVTDAVIVTDLAYRVQSWNRAAERIYGWQVEDVINQSIGDLLHTQGLASGDLERAAKQLHEAGWWQGEVVQYHKDGSLRHILGSVTLMKDETGVPSGIVAVNHDITERKKIEEALRKSAADIHDLYNQAPCGYHSLDASGLIVQINDTELGWLGYSREEVVGKLKITDIFTPTSVLHFQQNFPLFKERGWISDLEFDVVRKDGSIMHILLNSTAIYDAAGHYLLSRSSLFDITQLRHAQEAVVESEARYRLLAENVTDVIARVNPQGIRTFITPSCYALLGYTPEELIGKARAEIVHPEDRLDSKTRTSQAINASEPSFMLTQRLRHKNGHYVPVEIKNTAVRDPRTGDLVEVIGVIRDITIRIQAEETARARLAEEHEFQRCLKELHEITIELTGIDELDTFYLRAVELGLARLGFERLALFLYDETQGSALGTYGTDPQGKVTDERHVRFIPDPNGIMLRAFNRAERFYFHDSAPLYNGSTNVGTGWNAATVLWNGTRSLGWLVVDNLLSQKPASKTLLDILALYALTVGTLLAQKQVQNALRESEARYRLLAANVTDVISRMNAKGILTFVTPSCYSLTGLMPEELVDKSAFELVHPDDINASRTILLQAVQTSKSSFTLTQRIYHKAGHFVPVELTGSIIRDPDSGALLEVIAIVRDISERLQAEESLRGNERLLRLILETLPVGVWMIDHTGTITMGNPAGQQIWAGAKYVNKEQFGEYKAWWADTGKPLAASDWAASRAIASGESSLNEELEIEAFDGTHKFILNSSIPVRDEHGSILGAIVVNQDITERRQTAAELERQRSFLRNVIDVSPNMIFVKDYDARFVLVNPMVARMYNTSMDALIGRTDADFNPSLKEVDSFLEADRQVITSGESLFLEEPISNSAGEMHWLQTMKVPIISADGKSKYVLGVATDITERKRAEAALQESEAKYRLLIETMRGGLAIYDIDDRITYVNDRFCELLGYSRDEMIGTLSYEYVNEVDRHIIHRQLERRRHAESSSYEIVVRHKQGYPVHLLVSGSPLMERDGIYSGSFAVMTDISVQKQAEEALREALAREKELGELKSRFVSMASHEFRTPLATILAVTETLSAYRNRLSDDQIEQRLGRIKDQVGHLKDIMEDVLLLARMQARRVEFNPVKLDLDALCRSVLDEFESRTDITHNIEYTCSPVLHQVTLDKKLMRQIISNLVSNAIKYSPETNPVQVSLDYQDAALVLKVSDKGIGIPEADLKHLFEPFHRAANVGAISGTGLGLVIAKESVELHGGTIHVESQPDAGTTFTVRVAIDNAEEG